MAEELKQPRERNQIHAIIQISMTNTRNPDNFLRFRSARIRIGAEFAGVSNIASNEQYRSWRNSFAVVERVEVHELDVASCRACGCDIRC